MLVRIGFRLLMQPKSGQPSCVTAWVARCGILAAPDLVLSTYRAGQLGSRRQRLCQRCIPRPVSQDDNRRIAVASRGLIRPARSNKRPPPTTRQAAAKQTRISNARQPSRERFRAGPDVKPDRAAGRSSRRRRHRSVEARHQASMGITGPKRAARPSVPSQTVTTTTGKFDHPRNTGITTSFRYCPAAIWTTLTATRTTAPTR